MIKKILTLILVCVSLTFLGCKKTTPENTSSQVEILSTDIVQSGENFKADFNNAKESAKTWKENAQFVAVVLKVAPEMAESAITKTFVFGSSDDANNWWTYSVSGDTGNIVRSITPKEDYLGTNFAPIKEEFWLTSYVQALQSAENAGGTAFRAKNIDSKINILLAQTDPKGWLWWQVEYISGSERIKIIVNASDGKVYDENGELAS